MIRDGGALEQAMQHARERSHAALAAIDPLPASKWKDAMQTLARYSVTREF